MTPRSETGSTGPHTTSPGATLYGMYLIAVGAALVGNLLIRIGTQAGWLPQWGRTTVGVLAVVPLVWAAIRFWRVLQRDLDEMLQRIVLDGFAFALVLFIPLAALVMNLRTAGTWSPRLDPPDILFTPAILVAIGIAVAWRRYQ
jgi:hypothetical protein